MVWAKAEDTRWLARAKVRGPWDGVLPGWEAEIFPNELPDFPGPKIHLGRTLEEEDSHLGLCGRGSVFSAGREPGVGGAARDLDIFGRKDFKLGVRKLGVEAMFVTLEAFGTPATSLFYFETGLLQDERLARIERNSGS